MLNRYQTIYRAFQATTKKPVERDREIRDACEDVRARFGKPDHIYYGSPDMQASLEAAFPGVLLIHDNNRPDEFWFGFPEAGKMLVNKETVQILLDDAATLDALDPSDSLKRRATTRAGKTAKAVKTLQAMPDYDALAKEVAAVIAATPASDNEPEIPDDVPF